MCHGNLLDWICRHPDKSPDEVFDVRIKYTPSHKLVLTVEWKLNSTLHTDVSRLQILRSVG